MVTVALTEQLLYFIKCLNCAKKLKSITFTIITISTPLQLPTTNLNKNLHCISSGPPPSHHYCPAKIINAKTTRKESNCQRLWLLLSSTPPHLLISLPAPSKHQDTKLVYPPNSPSQTKQSSQGSELIQNTVDVHSYLVKPALPT